jgi:peptidylprolyl isomerase
MQVVRQGDRVQIEYVKRFQGGLVVSSRGKAPAEMTAGVAHRRLPGLGPVLVGMAVGESRTLLVPADRAYGAYEPGRIHRLAQGRFAGSGDLAAGKWVRVWDRRRRRRLVRVVEVRDKTVLIDSNHRWAGQSLELEVKVVAVLGPGLTPRPGARTDVRAPDPERNDQQERWEDDGGQG